MPVRIRKLPKGGYRVYDGKRVVSKKTTKLKALKKRRLLDAVKHGFKPRRR